MGEKQPTTADQLAAELRGQSSANMSDAEAAAAARNLADFMLLLTEIDRDEKRKS
jgi:hypothetical protein